MYRGSAVSRCIRVSMSASVHRFAELCLAKEQKPRTIGRFKETIVRRFRSHVCEILLDS